MKVQKSKTQAKPVIRKLKRKSDVVDPQINEAVKAFRKRMKLNQQEMADKGGVNRNAYISMENMEAVVPISFLLNLQASLGVPYTEFVSREGLTMNSGGGAIFKDVTTGGGHLLNNAGAKIRDINISAMSPEDREKVFLLANKVGTLEQNLEDAKKIIKATEETKEALRASYEQAKESNESLKEMVAMLKTRK